MRCLVEMQHAIDLGPEDMIEIIEVLPDQPGIAHDPCRVEDSIERAESEPGFDDQSLNVFTAGDVCLHVCNIDAERANLPLWTRGAAGEHHAGVIGFAEMPGKRNSHAARAASDEVDAVLLEN